MRRRQVRKLTMVLVFVLTGLILLPMLMTIFTASAKVTQSQIDEQKSRIESLEADKKRLQEQIARIRENQESALREKTALDSQIEIAEEEIASMETLIEMLADDLITKEAELASAQADERQAYELYLRRVRAMEEQPDAEYLGILLMSKDLLDFVTRLDVISDILSFDNTVRGRLARAREEIDAQKAAMEVTQAAQEATKADFEQRKEDLERQLDEAAELIAGLIADEAKAEKAYREIVELEEETNLKIQSLTAELARQNSVYVGGDYLWPLSGYSNITSGFGNRRHPISKRPSYHTGIDIGAPSGTPIASANAGVVALVEKNAAYGNYIVIDHGGGRATMYAHMNKRSPLNKGDKVKKGGVIGYVGSTGYSTGPHLHFEMWRDGTPYNPQTVFTRVDG